MVNMYSVIKIKYMLLDDPFDFLIIQWLEIGFECSEK